MPQAFVAVLVALGLGLCIGAACGAAGVIWGIEMARASRAARGRGAPGGRSPQKAPN